MNSLFFQENTITVYLSSEEVRERLINLLKRDKYHNNKFSLNGKINGNEFYILTNEGEKEHFCVIIRGTFFESTNAEFKSKVFISIYIGTVRKILTIAGLIVPIIVLNIIAYKLFYDGIQLHRAIEFLIGWMTICFFLSLGSFVGFHIQIGRYIQLFKKNLT
jgi:hypothetical protein